MDTIKPFKKYSRGELAITILRGLAAGGFILTLCVLPGLAQVITILKPKNSRDTYKIKRTIQSLENRNLIKKRNHKTGVILKITNQGKRVLLKQELKNLSIKKPKKWDGMWRIVIFDIPNTKRRERKIINAQLKTLGFIAIQKSIFIIPYECKNEIVDIKNYYGLHEEIQYILAKQLDSEKKLRRIFKLPTLLP